MFHYIFFWIFNMQFLLHIAAGKQLTPWREELMFWCLLWKNLFCIHFRASLWSVRSDWPLFQQKWAKKYPFSLLRLRTWVKKQPKVKPWHRNGHEQRLGNGLPCGLTKLPNVCAHEWAEMWPSFLVGGFFLPGLPRLSEKSMCFCKNTHWRRLGWFPTHSWWALFFCWKSQKTREEKKF